MDKNHSPWVAQLNKDRISHTPQLQHSYDVAIIGGGISGMVSAYYTLKRTKQSIILLEANRVAHGATGHNAGYIGDYFEKPFSEMVEEYGLKLASEGQKAVTSAWHLAAEILEDTKINIPFARFIGYAGCSTMEQLLMHLENKRLKRQGGLHIDSALIAKELIHPTDIPDKYHDLCNFVSHNHVLLCLETSNRQYIAALQSKKGTMNSALFVEKLSEYLLKTYPDRFVIREHAPVENVHLYRNYAILETNQHKITTEHVVLCTNGFENITIKNHHGADIDHTFHDYVSGTIGYMAGYVEKEHSPPMAISYFPPNYSVDSSDPYFYLTRRRHVWDNSENSLVCIGGPEEMHEDVRNYSGHMPYSAKAFEEINTFIEETYPEEAEKGINYVFKWHGLMGYTKSGIRCVGHEPTNPRLLYNLGCNGMGILPSIYAGKKIAKHLNGEEIEDSIFDPHVQRRVHIKR